MAFEPAVDGATSVVLAAGTAGGEDWELIAGRGLLMDPNGLSGLELRLDAESISSGTGGFDPSSDEIQMTDVMLGTGPSAQRIVFGAVSADAVRLGLDVSGGEPVALPAPEILDVPDRVDANLNAFVFTLRLDQTVVVTAFDDSNMPIASGEETPGADGAHPTPVPDTGQLEDGRHFGFVRSVDVAGRAIEFDLASWLSGEEANQAYQEAGGTGPVPNDHFVVNDSPALRTLLISPDLRLVLLDWRNCCDQMFEGDLRLFARAIELQDDVLDGELLYRGNSSWWITVENGLVTRIEEQYSP
jgi:hypothetical protein